MFLQKNISLETAVEKKFLWALDPNKEYQSWTKYQFDYLNI